MKDNLEALESSIGVMFKNKGLLRESMTHRSYLNENPNWEFSHNERLEYLGDAVLELAVTEELYQKFPEAQEGQLTLLRAALVNYQFLAKISEEINLQKYLFLSRGEAKDSSRAKEVILANAIESLLGAIYLDQGYEVAAKFVKKYVTPSADEVFKGGAYKDAKSLLQEIVQDKKKITPVYKLLEQTGPDHRKTFRMGVYVGEDKVAEGSGLSKQEAELDAAKNALESLS